MQNKTGNLEHSASWSRKAPFYDSLMAGVTTQAIEPILAALGDLGGKQHLDIACGTGHLVAAASRLGAHSVGIDLSAGMIEAAQRDYPQCRFQVGDAANLPFDEGSLDAVSCAFGLLHVQEPEVALAEAFRVLRPGGRLAFTQWFGPDRGNEYRQIVRTAFMLHADPGSLANGASNEFRLADEDFYGHQLQKLGFVEIAFQSLPLVWRSRSAAGLMSLIEKLSAHTAKMLDAQPQAIRRQIVDEVVRLAETHRAEGMIQLNWRALLTCARKPLGSGQNNM